MKKRTIKHEQRERSYSFEEYVHKFAPEKLPKKTKSIEDPEDVGARLVKAAMDEVRSGMSE